MRAALMAFSSLSLFALWSPIASADEPAKAPLPVGFRAGYDVDVEVHGWLRADYLFGDAIDDADGNDAFGVSKFAVVVEAKHAKTNTSATIVFGGGDLTGDSTPGDLDGDVIVADAFITAEKLFERDIMISFGLRPILFGLKPNGFPGDHTLYPSIEYGAMGNFASSNQAGASIVSWIGLNEWLRLELGTFDSDEANFAIDEGSNIVDNNFIQLRATNLAQSGLYASVGAERRYKATTDESEPVYSAGIGFQNDMFDVSVEGVFLDEAVAGTADDETYLIAEALIKPWEDTSFYFDYATADEADQQTYRLGGVYRINSFLTAQAEWARDDDGSDEFDSGAVRIAAGY